MRTRDCEMTEMLMKQTESQLLEIRERLNDLLADRYNMSSPQVMEVSQEFDQKYAVLLRMQEESATVALY